MKNRQLKQFAASFLVVLSLLASSVSAACNCAREHEESAQYCHSEHRQSREIAGEHHHDADSAETFSGVFSSRMLLRAARAACFCQSGKRQNRKTSSGFESIFAG